MKNKKKGFTLIEMIVVMAILVILVGIAIPQVTKTIAKSKKTADISTAKTIAGAMQQAIAEGKDIEESATWKEVNFNDLTGYIDNANSIKIKMNENYKFFYTYDKTNNVLKIGAGKDSGSAVELYPNPDPNYK